MTMSVVNNKDAGFHYTGKQLSKTFFHSLVADCNSNSRDHFCHLQLYHNQLWFRDMSYLYSAKMLAITMKDMWQNQRGTLLLRNILWQSVVISFQFGSNDWAIIMLLIKGMENLYMLCFYAFECLLCSARQHFLLKKWSKNCNIVFYFNIFWNDFIHVMVKLDFQHHYPSLRCHMILQKSF